MMNDNEAKLGNTLKVYYFSIVAVDSVACVWLKWNFTILELATIS